ncbi:hypothetical protein P7K49_028772, partial [Saguinus oedipus]
VGLQLSFDALRACRDCCFRKEVGDAMPAGCPAQATPTQFLPRASRHLVCLHWSHSFLGFASPFSVLSLYNTKTPRERPYFTIPKCQKAEGLSFAHHQASVLQRRKLEGLVQTSQQCAGGSMGVRSSVSLA